VSDIWPPYFSPIADEECLAGENLTAGLIRKMRSNVQHLAGVGRPLVCWVQRPASLGTAFSQGTSTIATYDHVRGRRISVSTSYTTIIRCDTGSAGQIRCERIAGIAWMEYSTASAGVRLSARLSISAHDGTGVLNGEETGFAALKTAGLSPGVQSVTQWDTSDGARPLGALVHDGYAMPTPVMQLDRSTFGAGSPSSLYVAIRADNAHDVGYARCVAFSAWELDGVTT